MPRRLSIDTTTARFALAAALAALVLGASSCGDPAGTTAYKDPVATASAAGPIIDAATLAKWADEGRINAPLGRADRVVVVSVTTRANFTSTTKKHIPDSVVLDYSTELTMTREEGLGPTGTMMLAGPQMDALVQRLGIDGSTTIVLTIPRASTDSEAYQQSVAYWTFRYWGFARERVKILNGGDDAWEVAGQPLTDAVVSVPPSTYSVTGNGQLKDVVRASVGEALTLVDQANRDRSVLDTWQFLDVRGFTTSPYVANTYRGSGGFQFVTDRVNGEATRNRLYPDRNTLIARLAASPVKSGEANAVVSPDKKMLVMCGSSTSASPTFVLFDAVLEVPEGDIVMYDGSSSQWNNYSVARIRQAGATTAQAATWAFDSVSPGTSTLRAVGALPAPVAGENAFVPGNFAYTLTQPEGNQIEQADKDYMAAKGGTSPGTPGGPGSSPGGGC